MMEAADPIAALALAPSPRGFWSEVQRVYEN